MKNINFAIIGFGGIAKTHVLASYIANLKYDLPYNINLTHIVTRRECANIPNGVVNEVSLDKVLSNPDIHFIDICTPNDSHLHIVKEAVKYNKSIYCEKPLSSNYEDALEMAQLVKQNDVKNSVALMFRFMPAVRILKSEMLKGTIGDIIDFKIKMYHKSYLNENKKNTWRTDKNSGGGALLDLGVHLIDMIQFTIDDVKDVKCNSRIFFNERTEVDEISNCSFILNNGVHGSLEVSRIFAEDEQPTTFDIYGTKGSIKISSDRPYAIQLYRYDEDLTEIKGDSSDDDILKYYPSKRDSLGFFQDCHTKSLIEFCNKIYDDKSTYIGADFEDALKCQKIIEKAYC